MASLPPLTDWSNLNEHSSDSSGTASPASSNGTLVDATRVCLYQRRLGDSELAYYLPSRENGVNDMYVSPAWSTPGIHPARRYLHLGFRAPDVFVQRERVRTVWAILRLRHPLLSSKIQMHDYNDVRFMYVNRMELCHNISY